jgi:hypothetical protein
VIIDSNLGTLPPVSSLISTGITAGGSIAAATGATTGLLAAIGIGAQAVPIVGTIIGGIALAVSALGIGNGCGESCIASTEVVNKVEPYLQQNLAAAQQQAAQNGGCLTSDEQAQAVQTFNTVWQYVVSNCTQVGGAGGSQCIKDRQAGGKWDWFKMYLTPIQNLPVCAASSSAGIVSSVEGGVSSIASDLGVGSNFVFWGGALLLGYLAWESL